MMIQWMTSTSTKRKKRDDMRFEPLKIEGGKEQRKHLVNKLKLEKLGKSYS